MPKNNSNNKLYNEITYIKTKKNNFKKFKVISFLVLCLAFVMIISDLFSNLLTLGQFKFSSFFGNDNYVKIPSFTLYVVNMDSFSNFDEAEHMAELVALQGASGYVWEKDNKYNIIGNVYLKKEHAENVIKNISTTNPKVFLSTLKFKQLNIDFSSYSKEQRLEVKKAINFLKEICTKLYDYTIKIETKMATPTTLSSYANNLKSECMIIGTKLDVINSTVIYEETIKIKQTYVKFTELLNELVIKLISGDNYHHITKYSYVNALHILYNLYYNL